MNIQRFTGALTFMLVLGACAHAPRPRRAVSPLPPTDGDTLHLTFEYHSGLSYELHWVRMWIDGVEVVASTRATAAQDMSVRPRLADGPHKLVLALRMQGMHDYSYRFCSSHAFVTSSAGTLLLTITSYEKGGLLTPVEERPAITYSEEIVQGRAESRSQSATPAGEGLDDAARALCEKAQASGMEPEQLGPTRP